MYNVNRHVKNLHRVAHQGSRENFLRLDMNENPDGLPKDFFEKVMRSITPEFVAMYPEYDSLLNKLAKFTRCGSNNICLTNGSDDAIRLLFTVFGLENKKVLSLHPTFEMYSVYRNMYGMEHEAIEIDNEFKPSVEKVINSITSDVSIVTLLNPNSPVGDNWREEEVKRIIEKAKDVNAVVVIDEAYYLFNPDSFLYLINEYDNVIIFRTFSKLLSIAGLRIGYIVSNESIIKYFKNASSTYPVNSIAVRFAEQLVDHPEIIKELIETEQKGRTFLLDKLQENNYSFYTNQGNYVFIKTIKEPEIIRRNLEGEGILVKTYNSPLLKDWLRVTTASEKQMERFWKVFSKYDTRH